MQDIPTGNSKNTFVIITIVLIQLFILIAIGFRMGYTGREIQEIEYVMKETHVSEGVIANEELALNGFVVCYEDVYYKVDGMDASNDVIGVEIIALSGRTVSIGELQEQLSDGDKHKGRASGYIYKYSGSLYGDDIVLVKEDGMFMYEVYAKENIYEELVSKHEDESLSMMEFNIIQNGAVIKEDVQSHEFDVMVDDMDIDYDDLIYDGYKYYKLYVEYISGDGLIVTREAIYDIDKEMLLVHSTSGNEENPKAITYKKKNP